MSKKRKAVFLDRDGVINIDTGYIKSVNEFVFYPFSAEAIKCLNIHEFLVIVVTNQAGIARGLFDEDTLQLIHDYMLAELKRQGAIINEIYYCPYHPDETVCKNKNYHKQSLDRKPNPGMIEKAIKKFDIDTKKSYLIGDSWGDIAAGQTMNITTIGVKTGNGVKNDKGISPDYFKENLLESVKWIIEQ